MIPKKKLQVFVSSTYKDLLRERQIAVEAILKAGHIPAGMELFSAGDQEQWEIIKKWIEESDVLLLILGGRYGSIEPSSRKSYTQLEYEYAKEIGKPFFAVIATEEYLEKKSKESSAKDVYEFENQDKLKSFKPQVESKMCAFWGNEIELKLEIITALLDFNNRDDLIGWVRGDMAVNGGALAEEMARLAKENAELRERLVRQDDERYLGLTFEELWELLLTEQIVRIDEERFNVEFPFLDDIRKGFKHDTLNLLHYLWLKSESWNGRNSDRSSPHLRQFLPKLESLGLIHFVGIHSDGGKMFNFTNEGRKFINKLKARLYLENNKIK